MVAILFARRDSIYKLFTDCDVYDIDRNALTWPGGCPVVAHPPCRSWGRLRAFAKPALGEHALALWAVTQVRTYGGVLEHPAHSSLWKTGLALPGERDSFGGWTLSIAQWWFGHRANKATWLYIVGCEPEDLPPIPFKIGEPTHVVASSKHTNGRRPEITKPEREHTPFLLAQWLKELAHRLENKPRP